jgi:hypothetical protein
MLFHHEQSPIMPFQSTPAVERLPMLRVPDRPVFAVPTGAVTVVTVAKRPLM